jgi:hypothetical protein
MIVLSSRSVVGAIAQASGLAFWGRALACWLLIALVESVHGVLRGLLLVPAIGEAAAQRVGFVVGCGLVLLVAWWTSRWLGARTRRAQWQAGALWLLLMLGFELLVGRARGFAWPRIAAEFDPSQGGLMLAGLLLIGCAPMLGSWLRRNA